MKIGILSTISKGFGRPGFYNGQEAGIGKELAARGHEVVIYKRAPYGSERKTEQICNNLRMEVIPCRSLGIHGFFPARELDPNLDIILMFADTQLCFRSIYRKTQKDGTILVPYVGIAHSFQRNFKSRFFDIAFRCLNLPIYRRIPVLAKTVTARDELLGMGVKDVRIASVGLDTSIMKQDFLKEDRRAIRAELGYTDDDVVVSYVALIRKEKRPVACVQAFKTLLDRYGDKANYRLLVVGNGPLRAEMESEAGKLLPEGSYQFVGDVPNKEIWKYHYASDFYINTNTGEIYGMAIMEAAYYHSCVAARKAPGPVTILSGTKSHGYFDSEDGIADFIGTTVPDEKALAEDVQSILARNSWKTCADELERLGGCGKPSEEG